MGFWNKAMSYAEAVKEWWDNLDDTTKIALESTNTDIPTALPSSYDNAEFDSVRVINGQHCKTVGEYKAAIQRQTGDDWSQPHVSTSGKSEWDYL